MIEQGRLVFSVLAQRRRRRRPTNSKVSSQQSFIDSQLLALSLELDCARAGGQPILTQHVLLHCDVMLRGVHQMLRMLWTGEANCILNFSLLSLTSQFPSP